MTAMSTSFITSIYADKDKYDYIVLNTGDIVIVDFNMNQAKRTELIESGYKQTMKYFTEILPVKKIKIKNNYEKILTFMLRIEKLINSRKIFKAKIELGDLFIELADLSLNIDANDFNDIKSFKDTFIKK